jgi:hypothetical protein
VLVRILEELSPSALVTFSRHRLNQTVTTFDFLGGRFFGTVRFRLVKHVLAGP